MPTKREMDVLMLLAKGHSAKRIGEALNISPTTVVTHIEHLKKKLCCRK